MSGLSCGWRLLVVLLFLFVGCDRAPRGIALPKLDPAATTIRALTEYDSNSDHNLSLNELRECPGLLSAVSRLDRDRDGSVSADELQAKLQEIQDQGAGLVAISCVVRHNNQPLEGATVKFVPEAFLGEAIKPAAGVTARDGTTSPSIAEEELPEEYRGRLQGVHCGVYRVVVTHPKVNVPEKYNTQTELGRLVTRRDHDTLVVDF